MSTATTDEQPDAEVIDLEPTMHIETAEPWATGAGSSSYQPEAVMAAAGRARPASRARSARCCGPGSPRRRCLLAVAYADPAGLARVRRGRARCLQPGFFWSRVSSCRRSSPGCSSARSRFRLAWLARLEYALFGGLTCSSSLRSTLINLCAHAARRLSGDGRVREERRDPDGRADVLYGTFIPNQPRTVAWVVLAMALAPLFGARHPDRAPGRAPGRSPSSGRPSRPARTPCSC